MTNKRWRKITSILVCAAMMLSIHAPVIAMDIEVLKLTPKASVVKSDAQVQAVMDRIDAIGTVEYTDDGLGKILTAKNAYAALSSLQRDQVDNYGKLLAARNGYKALAADKVDTSEYTITDNGVINSTVRWYVYSNGVLEVTGTGSVPSYSSNAPWQNYVSSIKTIIVRSTITDIGASAFAGCNNLTSITLPFVGESRTATGYQAAFGYIFGYITSADTSNSGQSAYIYHTDGSSERISKGGYSSPQTAFVNGLYGYVTDTDGKPWKYGFGNNTTLNYYYSQDNHWFTSYTYKAADSRYYLRTYVYQIPDVLKTVTITDASKIEDGAFNNCKNITQITLNDGVSSIGAYAFQH